MSAEQVIAPVPEGAGLTTVVTTVETPPENPTFAAGVDTGSVPVAAAPAEVAVSEDPPIGVPMSTPTGTAAPVDLSAPIVAASLGENPTLPTETPAPASPVIDTHAVTSASVGYLVEQLNVVHEAVPPDSEFSKLIHQFKDKLSEIEMFIRNEVSKFQGK